MRMIGVEVALDQSVFGQDGTGMVARTEQAGTFFDEDDTLTQSLCSILLFSCSVVALKVDVQLSHRQPRMQVVGVILSEGLIKKET